MRKFEILVMKRTILILIFALFVFQSQAQCPKTKYGIVPVWPIIWEDQLQMDWWEEMSDNGMGYFHSVYNWRQLQEMLDSNTFSSFIDDIEYGKNVLGFDKYLFLFQNPASFVNNMPPYICGSPFTDETVMRDMEGFICNLLDSMHHVIDYFAFGGEIDLYFKTKPVELDSFLVIASNVSAYIDQNYPEIKFGIVLTTRNGVQYDQTIWNRIRPISDMLAVTYWPITSNFHVIPSEIDSVERDINDLLAAADTLPLVIKEAGLPTHPMTGSSEALQEYFVYQTFIHTMYNNQIEVVGFDFLADFDTTKTFEMQAYYANWTSDFYYYIISLGLMDSVGNPKPAYPMYLSMLDTLCMNASIETADDIQVFPNPVSDVLHIDFEPQKWKSIELIDVSGKKVYQLNLQSEEAINIDVSSYAEGIYVLRILGEHFYSRKISILKNGGL
ncbi:MAG: T9SS type A sorting domain-containing protein [Bacteroidales bacterium]|nr:T9SS type A sorting domain-containing protein [Bacteroidales bacterium]